MLNLSDGTLTYEEQILELSKNERKILQTLLENPGAIVTRENLMMALWKVMCMMDETHVGQCEPAAKETGNNRADGFYLNTKRDRLSD